MGLFKPAWQSNDPNKREEAINKLNKQSILKEIALNDKVAYLRRMALEKIGDDDEFFIRFLCRREKKNGYEFPYCEEQNNREYALDRIKDERILWQIALQKEPYTSWATTKIVHTSSGDFKGTELSDVLLCRAAQKITDKNFLHSIAKKGASSLMRSIAYQKIGNNTAALVEHASLGEVAGITDKDVLARILNNRMQQLDIRLKAYSMLYSENTDIIRVTESIKMILTHHPYANYMGLTHSDAWKKREATGETLVSLITEQPELLLPFWDELSTEIRKPRSEKLWSREWRQLDADRGEYYNIDELNGLGLPFPEKHILDASRSK